MSAAAERPILATLLLLAWSCSAERSAWHETRRQDTPAAYESFLQAHGDGRYAAEASHRWAEIDFRAASRTTGLERELALARFLDEHSQSGFALRARRLLERLRLDRAQASGLLREVETFLAEHPDSPLGAEAREWLATQLESRHPECRHLRDLYLEVDVARYEPEWSEHGEEIGTRRVDLTEVFVPPLSVWLDLAGIAVLDEAKPGVAYLRLWARVELLGARYSDHPFGVGIRHDSGATVRGEISLSDGSELDRRLTFRGRVEPADTIRVQGDPHFGRVVEASPVTPALWAPGSYMDELARFVCECLGSEVLGAAVRLGDRGPLSGTSSRRRVEMMRRCVGSTRPTR